VKWRELAAAMEAEWERDKIIQLVHEHQVLMEATSLESKSEVDYGADLDGLNDVVGSGNRIRLWPERLQAITGGATEGDLLVLFGRPEVGKTLFSVNMTCGWLRDGHKVLYVGNEDNINKIKGRIRNNLSGMSPVEVEKFTDEANKRALRKGWNNLRAVHMFPGSVPEITKMIEEFEPKCVVLDQLRNLGSQTSKGGTKAQRLDEIAIDVRQMAAKHKALTLAVGQAHAPEHGKQKPWLSLDDFDESRTGVPGQADAMFGFGMDVQMDAANQRAISVPKNKLSGNHEGFLVNIDKQRSKIQ
jgi:KaiC/GvpD/RAD55 family RecA-like ATPase